MNLKEDPWDSYTVTEKMADCLGFQARLLSIASPRQQDGNGLKPRPPDWLPMDLHEIWLEGYYSGVFQKQVDHG